MDPGRRRERPADQMLAIDAPIDVLFALTAHESLNIDAVPHGWFRPTTGSDQQMDVGNEPEPIVKLAELAEQVGAHEDGLMRHEDRSERMPTERVLDLAHRTYGPSIDVDDAREPEPPLPVTLSV